MQSAKITSLKSFIYRINSNSPSNTQEDWFDGETEEDKLSYASSSAFVYQYREVIAHALFCNTKKSEHMESNL